jgi:hypothetical protein
MKTKFTLSILSALAVTAASGKGLYYVPNETEASVPITWSVGINAIWDDNTTPGGIYDGDETISLNPFVGVSFVSITPQTTWDVYARLGLVYYLDAPSAAGSDDTYAQSRLGVNLSHRFNERLRLTSRNFLSYELEPDYSYGFATSRQASEYFFWQTDNALGYRWTDRFATYTGFELSGLDYQDVPNMDRFTWTVYNQFRYQLTPQSVLTATYRYSETSASDIASDSTNQYVLVGLEHRFSPNTIMIVNVGAQFRDVDLGNSSSNPYAEVTLHSQINQQFAVRAFARYGAENYDTVVAGMSFPTLIEYDERMTLRVGVAGDYRVSQALSIFGGVDVIATDFKSGRLVSGPGPVTGADETLVNAYVGASLRFTDYLVGTLSYNHTNSSSDIVNRDYTRNRVTVGLHAEF